MKRLSKHMKMRSSQLSWFHEKEPAPDLKNGLCWTGWGEETFQDCRDLLKAPDFGARVRDPVSPVSQICISS